MTMTIYSYYFIPIGHKYFLLFSIPNSLKLFIVYTLLISSY